MARPRGLPRRSRQRALASSAPVVVLSLLTIVALLVFTLVPEASAAPEVKGGCGDACGGSCPTSGSLTFEAYVQPNATNVTLSWYVNPSSVVSAAEANITFGNTTSYGLIVAQDSVAGDTASYPTTIFVDYLEPSTTYYYKIAGWAACGDYVYHGTLTGSWTTSSESTTTISGIVTDPDGSVFTTGGLYVGVYCYPHDGAGQDPAVAVTTSTGHYSVSASAPKYDYDGVQLSCSSGPFFVQLLNEPTLYFVGLNGYITNQWPNHWNETFVIWAPQTVNFYLALDQPTPADEPIVDEMEFDHSSQATVTACSSQVSSVEFGTTSTASGSVFGFSFSVTSSTEFYTQTGSSGCISDQGEPGLEVWGEVETSGMFAFNAIDGRLVSIPWEQYYGGLINNGNAGAGNATGAPIQDWLSEPTSTSQACTMDDIVWYNYPIPANSGAQSYQMSVSGGISSVTGETWGISAPFDLDGTTLGTFSYSSGYTVTTSESNQFTVNFNIPSSSAEQHYTVACSGGAAGSGTGIVLHVWQDAT
jgi:hypothetical protein